VPFLITRMALSNCFKAIFYFLLAPACGAILYRNILIIGFIQTFDYQKPCPNIPNDNVNATKAMESAARFDSVDIQGKTEVDRNGIH